MKKNSNKVVAAFLSLALVFSAFSFAPAVNAAPKTKKLKLNATKKTLSVGGKFTLKVKKVTPAKANKKVTWKSSKKAVASVSKKGVVTAKKAGTANITAVSKSNKKAKAVCKITVKAAKTTPIAPASATPSAAPASAAPSASPAQNQTQTPAPTVAPPVDTPKPTASITLPEDSLKELSSFKIGTVVNYDKTQDVNFTALAKQQFDVVSFENEMKGWLLDVEASKAGNGDPVCDFTQADEMVEWAIENGLKIRGHVLIWAASTRDAFFYEGYDTSGKLVDKDTLLQRMKSYEELVITHFEEKYPDTVIAWDVVNEAISDSAPIDSTTGLRLNVGGNKFYDIIGGDFIKYAFQYAKEAVAKTGKDIKLFYNDFNTFQGSRTDCMIDLINYLNKDEKLLDCMGMEGYVLTYWPDASDVLRAMKRFAECGVQVGINELCVRLNDDIAKDHNRKHETVTEEEIADHAEKFKKMFEAYCTFNKEYPNTLTNVSIWALLDRPDLIDNKEHYDYSVYGTHSGLFTEKFEPKTAFFNVIDVLKSYKES